MRRRQRIAEGAWLLGPFGAACMLIAGIGTPVGARQAATPTTAIAATPAKVESTTGDSAIGLPLGAADLPETRTSLTIAPGVEFTRIVRGTQSADDRFTIDVAFVAEESAARTIADDLRKAGISARVEEVADRAPDDETGGPLGYRVRVGAFASAEEAAAERVALVDLGFESPRVVYMGEDGGETTGPWVVHVLDIEPGAYRGTVGPVLAAINGGFFVVGPTDGTPGDFAGVSVIDGRLLSEAVNGRGALLFPSDDGEGIDIATVASEGSVTAADGATRELDGWNREPGLIRGCGGVGGDEPTEAPKHDLKCTDESELVLFTPQFGQVTVAGDGFEVALDATGTVVERRERRGGEIPRDGSVVSGTGEGADWLEQHATINSPLAVEAQLIADGEVLDLAATAGIVNGGPRLVTDGEIAITAAAEGFVWEGDPGFYNRFGARRNPRTMAGVTADGRLLLVTVDGRQPGWSVGASFEEAAAIMRALSAEEAVNLDGGGSTAMAIGAELVNQPSDPSGERPDADAIVLLP